MQILTVGKGFIASHLYYKTIDERLQANSNQINSILSKYKPDIIINCIGYCGEYNGTIDACVEQKERTLLSNTIIPTILATECEKLDIRLISIGSGCIFYDQSPNISVSLSGPKDDGWKEENSTNPKSFYSKSKLACDLAIGSMKNTTTLRIRMPISGKDHPRNLLSKLIKYQRVVEEPNSMTFMEDLMNAIDFSIKNETNGIYHIASSIPLTHSVLLDEYCKYKPSHKYEKISVEELNKITKEPRSNCILSIDKAIKRGFGFFDTQDLVRSCVKKFAKNKKDKE